MTESQVTWRRIPLAWNVPPDLQSYYATNLHVLRTEHEFIISFFEAKMPVLVGRPDELEAKLDQIGSIQADCVARIIVAPDRMREFVETLQHSLEKHAPNNGGENPC